MAVKERELAKAKTWTVLFSAAVVVLITWRPASPWYAGAVVIFAIWLIAAWGRVFDE